MNFDDLTFYKTPLQDLFLRMRMRDHDSLRNVLRKNLIINEAIDEEISSRINGVIDNFITILIKGEQGTFKTSTLLEFLIIIDPSFCAENVCFIYDEFNQKLKNSVPKQAFELDEEVWQHGTGSMRIVNDTQSLIETLRKRQNSMGIACTTDKYFPEEIFTFYMETIDTCMLGTCPFNMEHHEIRSCKEFPAKEHHISEVYVRLGVIKRGHFIGLYIKKINWGNQLWCDYCLKKDLFLEQAKNMEFNKMNYEKTALEILKLPESHLYRKKSQIKLLIEKNKPNLTKEERDLLAEQIKMIRTEEEENGK